MDDAEPDVLAYMAFPARHRTKLHSTNPLERLNKEVKRHTDVVGFGGSSFGDMLLGNDADNYFDPDQEDTDNSPNPEFGGDDFIDGRRGRDTVGYGVAVSGVLVNMDAGTVIDGRGNTDTLVSIEVVIGSDFNDIFEGSSGRDEFNGRDGDDSFTGNAGADLFILGNGSDRVVDRAEGLNGDEVADFGLDDAVVITDAVSALGVSYRAENGAVRIDTDFDGTVDAVFTLGAPLVGGQLVAIETAEGVSLQYSDAAPNLVSGQRVPTSVPRGVDERYLVRDTDWDAEIEIQDFGIAAFVNALGAYEVDADGRITDVRLVSGDAGADKGDTLSVGEVAAGNILSFFIISNTGGDFADLDATDMFEFVDTNGGQATLDTDAPELLLNGQAVGFDVFHSGAASLNSDGLGHAVSGLVDGDLLIGFEDIAGGGDRDFEDVVFTLAVDQLAIA